MFMLAFLVLCAQPEEEGPRPGEIVGGNPWQEATLTVGEQNWKQVETLQAAVAHSGLPSTAQKVFSDLVDANFSEACPSGRTTWHLMILFLGPWFFFFWFFSCFFFFVNQIQTVF